MLYKKDIETLYRPEVLVVGGGPSGLCAALAAAREGADTMLIEQYGFCGGMATAGLVAPFMTCYDSSGGDLLIRGLFEKIVGRLRSRRGDPPVGGRCPLGLHIVHNRRAYTRHALQG